MWQDGCYINLMIYRVGLLAMYYEKVKDNIIRQQKIYEGGS